MAIPYRKTKSPFRTRSKFSRELLAFASLQGTVDEQKFFDKFAVKPLSSQLSHNDDVFLHFIQTSGCVPDATKISPALGRKATIREIAATLRGEATESIVSEREHALKAMDWGPQAEDQLEFLKEQFCRLRAHYTKHDEEVSEDRHFLHSLSPRRANDDNLMDEIITDYIVSASHLDHLRANRGEVGAILDGSRSPSRDDPAAPGRPGDLSARVPLSPATLTAAGGAGAGVTGGGGLHRRIATVLDGMRCHSAVLRAAVREHETPEQRECLFRSLRVRPGRLAPSELICGPASPSSPQWSRPDTGDSRYSPAYRGSGAHAGRTRPVSAALLLKSPPRDAVPHTMRRANSFSHTA